MVAALQPYLASAATSTLFAVSFRLLPFAVAAAARSQPGAGGRTLLQVGTAIWLWCFVLVSPMPAESWADAAIVYGYLSWLSALSWRFSATLARSPSWVLYPAAALASAVAPVVIADGLGQMLAISFGFETMFSLSSYVREAGHARARPSLGDAVFFIMVNPVLVYSERGTRNDGPVRVPRVINRFGRGVLVIYIHYFTTALLFNEGPRSLSMESGAASTIAMLGLTWLQLLSWYLGHSGTASIQIAGMRALGHEIHERYRYPLLARSPQDFWRRWNTYLGAWLYRYIFVPTSLACQRIRPRPPRAMRTALAVFAAFVVCGVAHEIPGAARHGTAGGGSLIAFVFSALVFVLWHGGEQAFRRLSPQTGSRLSPVAAGAGRLLFPIVLGVLASIMGTVFLPGLKGQAPW